ncbi:hypothetical protein [Marimonas arenosa]|uniref:Glutamine amidotransferase n=1 Tax=Marimonas arenosa TaxID=1795305 RepID=A0AAE4B4B4_9RHOB|nr:hypothetical protein [Marimonas arenosa]MDQ2090873.1 hypothetical protein [Marimonas arenosa]
MSTTILFDPLLPWPVLMACFVLALGGVALALWRGLSGWALRALGAAVILAALAGPVWQQEDREDLPDIALMVVDRSSSQQLAERAEATEAAADALATRIAALPNTELRRVELPNGQGDAGTLAMTALANALAEEPRARISGLFLISDGRVHDIDNAPDLPAPLHLLLTGQPEDWDRRLIVENAPAYAILGEEITLTLRVEDQGAVPEGLDRTEIEIAVDGGAPMAFQIPVGEPVDLPVTLPHGGRNVLQFTVPMAEGEITDRNNTALIQINGVRDRLRVLLVSGEPHPGGRTWRNLLKSDSSVDLVHFTILRPPEKQDGVPVSELSLIAFPTRELFLEKINDFDLIVFDRYKRRGILPSLYLDNVRAYAETGGAILIAAGPDFASADSLYRSPLAEILPASPTARVIEQGFRPEITELGQRHPVTAGLRAPEGQEDWGRWMRQIEVTEQAGNVVMSGHDGSPLLMLDRVGEGRVALLASDHAWLWSRGFEGGGPQLELLRRLAHWMMKEPELEEEALWAEPTGQTLRIIRRSLTQDVGTVTITSPTGETAELPLAETDPGRFEVLHEGDEIGLYRLKNGDKEAVVGLGPAAPREFVETVASSALLDPVIAQMRGGVAQLHQGIPNLRQVRVGRPAAGRGWLGLTPRGAFETKGVSRTPLLPAWLVLLLASALFIGAWLREGRR